MSDIPLFDLTAAERQKRADDRRRQERCRQRKRDDLRRARVYLPPDVVDALVENGWIGAHEIDDPDRLGDAVEDLSDCWARDILRSPKRRVVTP